MKPGPPNDPRDMRFDESDGLWRLLGESPRPEPSAWFTARTLALCRQEKEKRSAGAVMRSQLVKVWRWALAGGVAVSMAVALMMPHAVRTDVSPDRHNVQEAFEVVASMNTDSDSSSTSSWQDTSL